MKASRFIGAALAGAIVLAGCSANKTPSPAPAAPNASASGAAAPAPAMSTLNLWMPPLAADNQDKAMWDKILAPFVAEHKVKVDVTIVPWDAYETKYLTGVTSGNGPDVGYMYQEMIGDYTKRQLLVPLDGLITDAQKANLHFLDKGVFDGKQYSLPLVVGGARLFVYNKDILTKHKITAPKTWDELLATCKPLKAAGVVPLAAPWGDSGAGAMNGQFYPFVWQAGGKLFSDDGSKTTFDSPEVIRAATYLKKLKDEGCLPDDTTGVTMASAAKLFADGQAAFVIDTEQKAPEWAKAKINFGFEISLSDKQQGTFIASDSLVMLKQCKDQQLCAKLMDFITQGPQMTEFHKQAQFPPIGKDEKASYAPEFLEIYAKHSSVLHALPVVPKGAGAYTALYKNLQQMLNGEKSPEQAMADAAKEGNQAING